ncbi:MAG: hypothetical protein ACI8PZ_000103 [Myxococcota bacterium]
MQILVVGAGAVGQTYGYHLQRGGAELSFFVRDKYADDVRAGFTLYPLNGGDPVRLDGARPVTTAAEVAQVQWDQVWLAVSSPALRGQWLADLLAAAPGAVVVLLTPGSDDVELLQQYIHGERLVRGMISLIAYQAPLPGETRFADPGLAFWFPPRGPSPFSGQRAGEVVAALTAGGQPAKVTADVSASANQGSAMLMPILLGLEGAGWIWANFRAGDRLSRAAAGAREAMVIAARVHGGSPPRARFALRPLALRVLLWLAPKVLPLDIEVYLAYHFVKVGHQTRVHVRQYITAGRDKGLPTTALEALLAGVHDDAGDATAVAASVLARRSGLG